jgi:tripartite-type tricarboxylate transporter receptor subunit TctC
MLSGEIQLMFDNLPPQLPHIKAGKVRALAVWSQARSKALPQVPTIAEQGYPGYAAGTFVGINVAGGTPAPIVEKLYAAFAGALKNPAVREKLEELGFTPMALAPPAYAAFLHLEHEKWAKVIADTGLKGRE